MKNSNLFGFLIIIFFSACGQQSTTIKIENGWTSLIEENYKISYPEEWELDKSGENGTSFFLLSPISASNDKFQENVSLVIQDLKDHNLTLDRYIENYERKIGSIIKEGRLISSVRKKARDLEFQKIILTGKQGFLDFKSEQYYWVEENKAYALSFISEKDQFEKFQNSVEKILNSFEIVKN